MIYTPKAAQFQLPGRLLLFQNHADAYLVSNDLRTTREGFVSASQFAPILRSGSARQLHKNSQNYFLDLRFLGLVSTWIKGKLHIKLTKATRSRKPNGNTIRQKEAMLDNKSHAKSRFNPYIHVSYPPPVILGSNQPHAGYRTLFATALTNEHNLKLIPPFRHLVLHPFTHPRTQSLEAAPQVTDIIKPTIESSLKYFTPILRRPLKHALPMSDLTSLECSRISDLFVLSRSSFSDNSDTIVLLEQLSDLSNNSTDSFACDLVEADGSSFISHSSAKPSMVSMGARNFGKPENIINKDPISAYSQELISPLPVVLTNRDILIRRHKQTNLLPKLDNPFDHDCDSETTANSLSLVLREEALERLHVRSTKLTSKLSAYAVYKRENRAGSSIIYMSDLYACGYQGYIQDHDRKDDTASKCSHQPSPPSCVSSNPFRRRRFLDQLVPTVTVSNNTSAMSERLSPSKHDSFRTSALHEEAAGNTLSAPAARIPPHENDEDNFNLTDVHSPYQEKQTASLVSFCFSHWLASQTRSHLTQDSERHDTPVNTNQRQMLQRIKRQDCHTNGIHNSAAEHVPFCVCNDRYWSRIGCVLEEKDNELKQTTTISEAPSKLWCENDSYHLSNPHRACVSNIDTSCFISQLGGHALDGYPGSGMGDISNTTLLAIIHNVRFGAPKGVMQYPSSRPSGSLSNHHRNTQLLDTMLHDHKNLEQRYKSTSLENGEYFSCEPINLTGVGSSQLVSPNQEASTIISQVSCNSSGKKRYIRHRMFPKREPLTQLFASVVDPSLEFLQKDEILANKPVSDTHHFDRSYPAGASNAVLRGSNSLHKHLTVLYH